MAFFFPVGLGAFQRPRLGNIRSGHRRTAPPTAHVPHSRGQPLGAVLPPTWPCFLALTASQLGNLLGPLFFLVVHHRQVLVGALVLPLYPVALHSRRVSCSFFRAYPLAPPVSPLVPPLNPWAANACFSDTLVSRSLAPGGERYEVDVQMGCGLVHVEVGGNTRAGGAPEKPLMYSSSTAAASWPSSPRRSCRPYCPLAG